MSPRLKVLIVTLASIATVCLAAYFLGFAFVGCALLLAAGLAGAVAVALWRRRSRQHEGKPAQASSTGGKVAARPPRPARPPAPRRSPDNPHSLVETFLADGRFALLMRPQVLEQLSHEQAERARNLLLAEMSLLSEGEVAVSRFEETLPEVAEKLPPVKPVMIDAFYLDRYAVTNRQFQQFVDAGGYQEQSLWNVEIWPAVEGFLDSTGLPGPRYWEHSAYREDEEDLPVVGVSWYEAAAFARWLGKQLPCDAQWQKAAGCPVAVGAGRLVQRRYPWGDTMDRARCNVWGSEPGRIVSVFEFAVGACSGGVHQLVGNVWEWTLGDFGAAGAGRDGLVLPTPMKSIRGGAYDTYFDTQCTAHFQSGENPMSRKHNISFRCALPVACLEPDEAPQPEPPRQDETPDAPTQPDDEILIEVNV